MSPAKLAVMSPQWITHLTELEIVATTLETFRGPRFASLTKEDSLIKWSAERWWFPKSMMLYHVNWRSRLDGEIFHRMRLDPSIDGVEGDSIVLSGGLRLNVANGTIANEQIA